MNKTHKYEYVRWKDRYEREALCVYVCVKKVCEKREKGKKYRGKGEYAG